jgi:signal transduction histidine kinase
MNAIIGKHRVVVARSAFLFLFLLTEHLFNSYVGMSGCLLETDLTPLQQDYVNIISTSSEELLNIINDILDFSKVKRRAKQERFCSEHMIQADSRLKAENWIWKKCRSPCELA